MKLYYDLHIHSSLSPCGDDDMTPNNIVHMAMLKELNMIAVTDHNSARNLPAVKKVADECGIFLIPGIEVTTAEEIHLLTYFETVEETMDFGEYIYDSLPDISNRPEIFGEQKIMDETDAVTGHLDKLLLTASCHSIDALCREVRHRGGVPVPAHVNRESNSILMSLGFIPADLEFSSLEVAEAFPLQGVNPAAYRVLYSSDAHYIMDIAEKRNYLNCDANSAAVLEKIKTIP